MFERFAEGAIKVIMLAQEEVRRLGHNSLDSEFILLGLIGEGGTAYGALSKFGINLKRARDEVEKLVGRGSGFVPAEIPFSPRAKHVLELSWKHAKEIQSQTIDSKHLLVGLIDDALGYHGGHAEQVLESLEVNLADLREAAINAVKPSKASTGVITDVVGASVTEDPPMGLLCLSLETAVGTTLKIRLSPSVARQLANELKRLVLDSESASGDGEEDSKKT